MCPKSRHQGAFLKPRGVYNRNAKERYVEILSFQHFANYTTFITDDDDFKNKVIRDKIDVSVVLDIECVDMFARHFD
jgi:hypothetical protein